MSSHTENLSVLLASFNYTASRELEQIAEDVEANYQVLQGEIEARDKKIETLEAVNHELERDMAGTVSELNKARNEAAGFKSRAHNLEIRLKAQSQHVRTLQGALLENNICPWCYNTVEGERYTGDCTCDVIPF